MPNLFRALYLIVLVSLLAGCKTVTIDEGFVFQPEFLRSGNRVSSSSDDRTNDPLAEYN